MLQPASNTNGAAGRKSVLFIVSLLLVFGLAVLAARLSIWGNVPFKRQLLEYPLWAVMVGLAGGLLLRLFRIWEPLTPGFRTELFLKTGLVLLGATVNISAIVSFGAKGVIQALVLITSVFFFTWFMGRLFGLEQRLRAVMSTAVSICGVSAAIAAAGSVLAKKETLAYITTLVILFALPLMVLMPYVARGLGLSDEVAGAWIGGNIDTTAAVVGSAAIYGEQALKVASVVKLSQNALIGVAAFFLALYWVLVIERKPEQRPHPREIWDRFPKFVIGFVIASAIASLGLLSKPELTAVTNLRNWFLTAAFVSIGLQFSLQGLRQLGWRPVLVFFIATIFNTLVALGVASLLFA